MSTSDQYHCLEENYKIIWKIVVNIYINMHKLLNISDFHIGMFML